MGRHAMQREFWYSLYSGLWKRRVKGRGRERERERNRGGKRDSSPLFRRRTEGERPSGRGGVGKAGLLKGQDTR